MTRNSCKFVEIARNYVNFPFTGVQCQAVGDNMHESISIEGNTFADCAIYRGYLTGEFDAVLNFDNTNGATITDNILTGNYIKDIQAGSNAIDINYYD